MPVNVRQWRMEIANFNNSISNSLCDHFFYLTKSLMVIASLLYAVLFKHERRTKVKIINIYLGPILYWNILSSFMSNIWYCKCLLWLSGDIGLNSITSHNFIKVSLLTAYHSFINLTLFVYLRRT